METLEQMRSKRAWKDVSDRAATLGPDFKKYKITAKGAPMMIMNSGLMATLAFYQSRGEKDKVACQAFVLDIMRWLAEQKILAGIAPASGTPPRDPFAQVMGTLLNAPSVIYQQATTETLAYLRWLRQFADAVDTQSTPKQ